MIGITAAFFSSVTWALGGTVYGHLSKTNHAASVNLTRALIAFPCFLSVYLLTNSSFSFSIPSSQVFWLCVSVIAGYAVGDVFFLASAKRLGITAAMAIACIYPFWSALSGVFFKGEVLTLTQILGLVTIVLGTIVIVLLNRPQQNSTHSSEQKTLKNFKAMGVLFAFITSIFWALNSYAVSEGAKDIDIFLANTARMSFAIVLCPAISFLALRQKATFIHKHEFKKYGFVFLLESFFGSLLYIYGLTHAPLSIASALTSLGPVITVPFALLFRWEKFSLPKTASVGCVTLGIILLVS